MNEEQRKFFEIPFEKREAAFFKLFPDGKLLKKKLLAIGGSRVVWMPEDQHLSSLITSGSEFSLDKRKKTRGETNRCHTNVARLFFKKNMNIATGYALADDRWIQHSWGYDGKKIFETTCLFDAYYGVVLSGLDITMFVVSQLGDEVVKLPREQIMKLPMPEDKSMVIG
jgi:hypothetical protein